MKYLIVAIVAGAALFVAERPAFASSCADELEWQKKSCERYTELELQGSANGCWNDYYEAIDKCERRKRVLLNVLTGRVKATRETPEATEEEREKRSREIERRNKTHAIGVRG